MALLFALTEADSPLVVINVERKVRISRKVEANALVQGQVLQALEKLGIRIDVQPPLAVFL